MPFNIDYEFVAYMARYLFLALTVIILAAFIYVSRREYLDKKDIRNILSAYSGYLEIVEGPEDFLGDQFGVAKENLIGCAHDSDILIEGAGVAPYHARIAAVGDAFRLEPVKGAAVFVNGSRVLTGRPLKTGDVISVGDIDLVLRLKRKRINHDA